MENKLGFLPAPLLEKSRILYNRQYGQKNRPEPEEALHHLWKDKGVGVEGEYETVLYDLSFVFPLKILGISVIQELT